MIDASWIRVRLAQHFNAMVAGGGVDAHGNSRGTHHTPSDDYFTLSAWPGETNDETLMRVFNVEKVANLISGRRMTDEDIVRVLAYG